MSAKPGHETSDLPARWVTLAVAGLISLLAVGALAAWALVAGFRHAHPAVPPNAYQTAAAVPALPRLEVDGRADRLALEARVRAELTSYGWSDRAAGLAHIPIERAMTLQAQQGWPDPDMPSNAAATNAAPTNALSTNAAESAP